MESLTVRTLLAFLPLVLALYLLVGRRMQSSKAMPLAWMSAVIIAGFYWRMPPAWLVSASIYGALTAFNILLILFGALLLLNSMKSAGALATISAGFFELSGDRRVQALIVGFGFAVLIEGGAGFGAPAALAAPLLVGIGFPPLAAATLALIGHAPGVAFGAAGAPIIGGIGGVLADKELPYPLMEWVTKELSAWIASFHILGAGLLIPLILVVYLTYLFGEPKSIKKGLEVWPLALTAGFTCTFVHNVAARLVGPELPSVLAGAAVIAVLGILARRGVWQPRVNWDFPAPDRWPLTWRGSIQPERPQASVPFIKAWLPYLLVMLLLVITRLEVLGLRSVFIKPSLTWSGILGTDLTWRWDWLFNPGIFPFMAITLFSWVLYNFKSKEAERVVMVTIRQLFPAVVAMASSVAMAQVMMQSGQNLLGIESMLISLAEASARIFGGLFFLVSPWIGLLGSFMSGSNTVSNILFARYQFEVAETLSSSRTIMVVLQSGGAAVGNMVTIHNIIAALTVVGCLGREGLVLKRNIVAASLYIITLIIVGLAVRYLLPNLF